MTRFVLACTVLAVLTQTAGFGSRTATAEEPPANKNKDYILGKILDNKPHVEKSICEALLKGGLPNPLVTDTKDWGKQEDHAVVVFKGVKPTVVTKSVNSGLWRRVTVRPQEKAGLEISLVDAKKPDPKENKYTLTSKVGLDCAIELEVEDWFRGAKMIGGHAEVTCRAILTIECELTLVPVFKFPPAIKVTNPKVLDTTLVYENLKTKKLGPVALVGKPAEYFSDKLVAAVKKVKPTLESELLDKANTAVREKVKPLLVKAIDNMEFGDAPEKKVAGKSN